MKKKGYVPQTLCWKFNWNSWTEQDMMGKPSADELTEDEDPEPSDDSSKQRYTPSSPSATRQSHTRSVKKHPLCPL